VFERVVEACIAAGLVGGEGFAVDASLIVADANKQRSIPGRDWDKNRDPETASLAVKEYLATLDDAAFGAASDVTPEIRFTVRSGRPVDGRDARASLLRLCRQLSDRREVCSARTRRKYQPVLAVSILFPLYFRNHDHQLSAGPLKD
jgi:hypothetical protein